MRRLRGTPAPLTLKTLRWAFMTAILFWTVVYRLGSDGSGLPQFVYVNF
jgi:hypothetical protein